MSLENEIAELRKAIVDLTAVVTNNNIAAVGAPAAEKPAAEKPTTGKRKAEKPAAEKPAAEKPKDDDLDLDGNATTDDLGLDDGLGLDEEAAVVTKDELKVEFQTLAKKAGGREAVQDILKSFKATSFNDLKEADFAAALKKVKAAL